MQEKWTDILATSALTSVMVGGCIVGLSVVALNVGLLGGARHDGSDGRMLSLTQARAAMADIGKGGVMVTSVMPGPEGSGLTAAYVRTGGSKKPSIVWLHGRSHPYAIVGNLYNERGEDINAPYLNMLGGRSEAKRPALPPESTLSMSQPPFDPGKPYQPVPAAASPNKTNSSAEPSPSIVQAPAALPQASLLDPTKHAAATPAASAPQTVPAGASIAAQRKAAILAYMATPAYQDGGTAAVPALMVRLVEAKSHRFAWRGASVPPAANAPTVYFFFDPNCIVCHTEYQGLSRYVESGQIHVEMIPVGFLKPDSAAKAAAILTAGDPDKALASNEADFDTTKESGGIAPKAHVSATESKAVDDNTKLLALVDGEKYLLTPTLLVQDPQDGTWVRITSEISGQKLVQSLHAAALPATPSASSQTEKGVTP